MKTKELIKELQEIDPDGELEVTVGKSPIYYLETLPSYYDGPRDELIQDQSLDPHYNITGIRVIRDGYHVCINTMRLDDVLTDNPDAIVEYDYEPREWDKQQEEHWRNFGRELKEFAEAGGWTWRLDTAHICIVVGSKPAPAIDLPLDTRAKTCYI